MRVMRIEIGRSSSYYVDPPKHCYAQEEDNEGIERALNNWVHTAASLTAKGQAG
jgi:hypothetical protein